MAVVNMYMDQCVVDGCSRARRARQMCSAHYKRFRRNSSLTTPLQTEEKASIKCKINKCTRIARYGYSLCSAHLNRKSRGLPVDVVIPRRKIPVINGSKECSKCGKTFPVDHFNKSKRNSSGYGGHCVFCRRDRRRNYTFGLSVEEYEKKYEAQKGLCAVCKQPETALNNKKQLKPLSIDHCHKSGQVRALLCSKCNCALGLINDDINIAQSIISYLMEWNNAS